jgi:hypothetical protein
VCRGGAVTAARDRGGGERWPRGAVGPACMSDRAARSASTARSSTARVYPPARGLAARRRPGPPGLPRACRPSGTSRASSIEMGADCVNWHGAQHTPCPVAATGRVVAVFAGGAPSLCRYSVLTPGTPSDGPADPGSAPTYAPVRHLLGAPRTEACAPRVTGICPGERDRLPSTWPFSPPACPVRHAQTRAPPARQPTSAPPPRAPGRERSPTEAPTRPTEATGARLCGGLGPTRWRGGDGEAPPAMCRGGAVTAAREKGGDVAHAASPGPRAGPAPDERGFPLLGGSEAPRSTARARLPAARRERDSPLHGASAIPRSTARARLPAPRRERGSPLHRHGICVGRRGCVAGVSKSDTQTAHPVTQAAHPAASDRRAIPSGGEASTRRRGSRVAALAIRCTFAGVSRETCLTGAVLGHPARGRSRTTSSHRGSPRSRAPGTTRLLTAAGTTPTLRLQRAFGAQFSEGSSGIVASSA